LRIKAVANRADRLPKMIIEDKSGSQ